MELPPPCTGRVGVIQPISVALLEQNEEAVFEPMVSRPGSWFVACDGRTRTREAREANRRIRAGGGGEADIIRVRFEIKKVDGAGAVMLRDIAQRCRKVETPLDLAQKAERYIIACTPKPVVLQAMGLTSWRHVENYAALRKLDPKLQALVDANQVPMREALKIGRTKNLSEQRKLAAKLEEQLQAKQVGQLQTSQAEAQSESTEKPAKLTGKEVAAVSDEEAVKPKLMQARKIKQWIEYLQAGKESELSAAVVAVLNTILGVGDMTSHPDVAPPSKARKRNGKGKKTRQTEEGAGASPH